MHEHRGDTWTMGDELAFRAYMTGVEHGEYDPENEDPCIARNGAFGGEARGRTYQWWRMLGNADQSWYWNGGRPAADYDREEG